eukprot:gnl/MRDRNA2_/MRDRNA2_114420_c0_seq1.p1 gnl/MRDRNA2_/MRDRNA2_114420_c0~~gnl/MRDRNA2_/MRDRNA2_114420_c0_seq1.p1  ORF type:complete len:429 (-),score=73.25 gnl/MRDRNA2_/MRDRNA2_114420_c0_seq1:10-1296(-)
MGIEVHSVFLSSNEQLCSMSLDTAARILPQPHTEADLVECGARLRSGKLVSFPTETVYGLGANGLDAQAVLSIFEAKGRPLTDPCILHVNSASAALDLVDLGVLDHQVFCILSEAFWPGPLSIVGRRRPHIPDEVTASTPFVAVRCPSHPIAQQLLEKACVPVAAPSANRFGHISPTSADHVLADLNHVKGLHILDGGSCSVGIESTVVRLDGGKVIILRKGGVTQQQLIDTLDDAFSNGKLTASVDVSLTPKLAQSGVEGHCDDEKQAQPSPGLLLKHYAPALPTGLLSVSSISFPSDALPVKLDKCILVDFGKQFESNHNLFLETIDLCDKKEDDLSSDEADSVTTACARLFAVLREAEARALKLEADMILLADFPAQKLGQHAEALHDRLFRAASGRKMQLRLAGTGAPCLCEIGAPPLKKPRCN